MKKKRSPEAPTFSQDWFSRSIPAWDYVLTEMSKIKPALRILEVGVFEGLSTCWLLKRHCKTADCTVVAVDSFRGGIEHQGMALSSLRQVFESNIRLVNSPAKVDIREGNSLDELAKLVAEGVEPFDFVSIDASHQSPDVLGDAVLGFRLLARGGVMAFDDYLWDPYGSGASNPLLLPKSAIDAFTTIFSNQLKIVPNFPLYQLYIQKF